MKKRKRTRISVSAEGGFPKALILKGDPKLTYVLYQRLEEKGCQVVISSPKKLRKGKLDYDYIFILEDLNNLNALLKSLRTKKTKILLLLNISKSEVVEGKTYSQIAPFIRAGFNIRALKVKEVLGTDVSPLIEKILKITFEKKTQGKVFFFAFSRKKIKEIKPAVKKPLSLKKEKKRGKIFVYSWGRIFLFFFALFALFSFLTYPFFFFALNLYQGGKNLKASLRLLEKGEIIQAETTSKKAIDDFNSSKQNLKQFKKVLTLSGLKDQGDNLERLVNLAQRLAFISYRASFVGSLGSDLGKEILSSEGQLFKERLEQIKIELEQIDQELAFAKAEISELEDWRFPGSKRLAFKKTLSELKEKIPEYRQYISLGKKILSIFPALFSVDGEKSYLVLFENNMELRPTGGFIGSFALLTFDKGKLLDFKIEDVYNADGNLKGHVDPPLPIRKFLNQPHWYLRDSNWNPDFAESALQAEWFLEKEIGVKVDGVISVDLTFVQNLLRAIGGVTLTDYKEVITADNLFLKAQAYVQKDFFPGSTQKKDFLGAMLKETLTYLTSNPNLPYLSFAQAIKKSLEEKHLAFYFHDVAVQRLAEELGWGGRVSKVKCFEEGKKCFADYLMLVEANLGVNKANYFVKKRVEKETEFLEGGTLKEKLTVVFENNSPSYVFPAGPYKNYLRILVPKKTAFEELKIGGKKIPFKEIDEEESEDKKILGFYFEVPPSSQKEIVFSYILREDFDKNKEFSYQFLIQKQLGTGEDPLILTFKFPSLWRISYLNFKPLDKNKNLGYNQTLKAITDLSVDRVFRIDFSKP